MNRTPVPIDVTLLQRGWEWVRTSVWLLPTALCLAALLLALAVMSLDRHCHACLLYVPAPQLSVDAARQLMGVLVTSVLSVGGVLLLPLAYWDFSRFTAHPGPPHLATEDPGEEA